MKYKVEWENNFFVPKYKKFFFWVSFKQNKEVIKFESFDPALEFIKAFIL